MLREVPDPMVEFQLFETGGERGFALTMHTCLPAF